MKQQKLVLAISLLLGFVVIGFSQSVIIKTSVTKALLYTNGAYITRTGQSAINTGKQKILFTDLPGNIDIESLQLASDEKTKINFVKPYYSYKKPESDIQLLERVTDTIKNLHAALNLIDIKRKILEEEETILKRNQPSFTNDFMVKPADLKLVLEFNSAKLTDIYMQRENLNNEYEYKLNQIQNTKRRLIYLQQNANQPTVVIETEVETSFPHSAEFTITYFTLFASWTPTYDLRVKDITEAIDLTLKASIIQNTREDWKEVELSVSNGQPSGKEIKPEILPWYLRFYQPYNTQPIVKGKFNQDVRQVAGRVTDQKGEPMIGAILSFTEQSSVGTITDIYGKYYLPVPQGVKSIKVSYTGFQTVVQYIEAEQMNFVLSENMGLLDAVSVLGARTGGIRQKSNEKEDIISDYSFMPVKVSYQPTTFSYRLKEKADVPWSTNPLLLEITEYKIPTIYEYISIPKYDPSVFLEAGLPDWREYNLLSGNVNLYLEGKFTGQSLIDTKKASDTLWVSLGRDQNIIIEKTLIKDFVKKSFLSGSITEIKAYIINVRNNKRQAVSLKILDHFPISTDKSIEITNEEAKGAFIHPETKLITWTTIIPPSTEIKKEMRFTVKYPSGKRLELD